ncbi:Hpt domain-containing protein [Desulfonatronum parangueonense]
MSDDLELLNVFRYSSQEHLDAMESFVLDMEHSNGDMDLVDAIFRLAHTLKGDARTYGRKDIESMAHEMENTLSEIRTGQLEADKSISVLLRHIDRIRSVIDHLNS